MMSCFCIECERNARASEDARIDAGQERAMREAAERVTDKVRQERDALRAEVERLRRVVEAARALLGALPRCWVPDCQRPATGGVEAYGSCARHRSRGEPGPFRHAEEMKALETALNATDVGR